MGLEGSRVRSLEDSSTDRNMLEILRVKSYSRKKLGMLGKCGTDKVGIG